MHPRVRLACLLSCAVCVLAAAAHGERQTAPAPLSLEECVRIALEKSPDLSIAERRLAQVTAQLRKTYAPFSPQGTFSANQIQLGYDQFGVLNKGDRWDNDTHNATVSAEWNLFNGFRDMDRWQSARHDRRSHVQSLAAVRREIAVQALRAYYGLLLADKTIDVQKENLRSKQEHHRLAQARFRAGVRSYSDVLNAQIQMKQGEIQLIDAESKKKSALFALNILLDRPVSAPTVVADETGFEPVTEDLEQNVRTAFDRRPEVLQAQEDLRVARAASALAAHDILPVLSVGGVYNYAVSGAPAGTAGSTFFNRNPFWQVNLGLNFPFWDGGVRLQEIRRSGEGVRIGEDTLEKTRRSVRKDVADAYLDVERNQRIHQVAKDQVRAAREDLTIVAERYKNGAASALEIVDAQANLLRVQLDAIESLYNFHIAKFELKRASGLAPL